MTDAQRVAVAARTFVFLAYTEMERATRGDRLGTLGETLFDRFDETFDDLDCLSAICADPIDLRCARAVTEIDNGHVRSAAVLDRILAITGDPCDDLRCAIASTSDVLDPLRLAAIYYAVRPDRRPALRRHAALDDAVRRVEWDMPAALRWLASAYRYEETFDVVEVTP
jgi:hypothetical protein